LFWPRSRGRELLLGKNLALAPILLGIGVALALVVGAVLPMRVDHYPMVLAQLATMYLLYCLLMNFLSIVAPMAIAAGAMQPTGVKLGPVLWQFGFMMVYPPVVGLVLLPVGIEVLVEQLTQVHWLPIGVVLSFGLLAVAVLLYRRVLAAQGNWLAKREKDILLVVTSKVE
jgi:ABC-2 type transport system permease protein